MPEKKSEQIVAPGSICQIGIVVNSVDETIKYYKEKFGFGPFEVRNVDYSDATYHGKKAGYRGKRGFFKLGPIEIELIELIDGKTVHDDWKKIHGEGIHHIGFQVENIEASKKAAEKAGFKITQGFTRPDGSGFAYLDNDKVGGTVFELIQPQKK
jgi:methylmalonyl-CoA/ethylmalonyl-CoA epimerase